MYIRLDYFSRLNGDYGFLKHVNSLYFAILWWKWVSWRQYKLQRHTVMPFKIKYVNNTIATPADTTFTTITAATTTFIIIYNNNNISSWSILSKITLFDNTTHISSGVGLVINGIMPDYSRNQCWTALNCNQPPNVHVHWSLMYNN